MKKLVFSKPTSEQMSVRGTVPDEAIFMSLYNIYTSNEEKLTTRADIRASAKLVDAFETLMDIRMRDVKNGDKTEALGEFVMKPIPVDGCHELLLDDVQFALLFGAVKKFQPSIPMARLFDKIYEYMEAVEKQ